MGDAYVNGTKVNSSGSFARMASYVEQEDALIGSLTVRETLQFSADLSLPWCIFPISTCWYTSRMLTNSGIAPYRDDSAWIVSGPS